VSYQLSYSPIHVSRTAKRDTVGRQAFLLKAWSDKKDLKIEINSSLALISIIPQVREGRRVNLWTRILRFSERSECFRSDHPG